MLSVNVKDKTCLTVSPCAPLCSLPESAQATLLLQWTPIIRAAASKLAPNNWSEVPAGVTMVTMQRTDLDNQALCDDGRSGSESHVGDTTDVSSGNSEESNLSPSASPAVLHSEVCAGVTNTDDGMASAVTVPVVVNSSPIPHEVISNAVSNRQGS
eukprot:sb/3473164/